MYFDELAAVRIQQEIRVICQIRLRRRQSHVKSKGVRIVIVLKIERLEKERTGRFTVRHTRCVQRVIRMKYVTVRCLHLL